MARGLAIRDGIATAGELRRLAKKEPRRRTVQRMLALANAMDGMSRGQAARAAGVERQSLRDAVLHFNAEGLAGLIDRPPGRRPERLTEGEQAASGSWTKPESGRKAGQAIAGGCGASARPDWPTIASACLSAAVRPATGEDFTLVLPRVSTAAMTRFLADFAQTLRKDAHAVLVLDQAGWHRAKALKVPASITLVSLPAYSPDLNPVELVWLYLRECYLSHRLLADYEAVVEACCRAWNALTAETGRLRSLTDYPYLEQIRA